VKGQPRNANEGELKPGKAFELMVERIQKLLHGALAGKPDSPLPPVVAIERGGRLRDLDTGVGREIDIILRYRLAGTHFLVIVECRDRCETQDVLWVEQVYGKMRSVGAHGAILVSRSGFAAPAVIKAHNWGMTLIHYREVDPSDQFGGSYFNIPYMENSFRVGISGFHSGHNFFPIEDEPGPEWLLKHSGAPTTWEALLSRLAQHLQLDTLEVEVAIALPVHDLEFELVVSGQAHPLSAVTVVKRQLGTLPHAVETFIRVTPQGGLPVVICAEYNLTNGTGRLYHIKSGEDAGPVAIDLPAPTKTTP